MLTFQANWVGYWAARWPQFVDASLHEGVLGTDDPLGEVLLHLGQVISHQSPDFDERQSPPQVAVAAQGHLWDSG